MQFAQMDASPDAGPLDDLELDQHQDRDVRIAVEDVVPWVVSIGAHLAVMIITMFFVWNVVLKEEKEAIVPELRLSRSPGTPVLINRQKVTPKQSVTQRSSPNRMSRSSMTITETKPSEIGASGGPKLESPEFGSGPSIGEGFNVDLFGTGGNAKTVVFVIDSSGSLLPTMPFVIDELKRAIGELGAKQRFSIFFFMDGKAIEVPVPRKGLRKATADTKQTVIEWIDLSSGNIKPTGKTDPTEAIRKSLVYEPDLLFLLSDNIIGSNRYGLDPDALIETIRKANAGSTVINTIQFVQEDPVTRFGLEATLKRISDMTKGQYKFVSHHDLGTR